MNTEEIAVIPTASTEDVEKAAHGARIWSWINRIIGLALAIFVVVFGVFLLVQNADLQRQLAAQTANSQRLYDQLVSLPGVNPDGQNPSDISQGPTGPAGSQGLQGPKGDTGPEGLPGLKGDKGDTGVGVPGATGEQGTTGTPGSVGSTGATGANGTNGVDGAPGATGAQGPIGPIGPQGPQGEIGPAGPTGGACPDGYTGTTLQVVTVDQTIQTIYACIPG